MKSTPMPTPAANHPQSSSLTAASTNRDVGQVAPLPRGHVAPHLDLGHHLAVVYLPTRGTGSDRKILLCSPTGRQDMIPRQSRPATTGRSELPSIGSRPSEPGPSPCGVLRSALHRPDPPSAWPGNVLQDPISLPPPSSACAMLNVSAVLRVHGSPWSKFISFARPCRALISADLPLLASGLFRFGHYLLA